jgi:prevent-host-death family protein
MDKAISAAEANRQFSRILREVKAGDSFTVTSHGEKVARIVPIDRADEAEREKAWHALLERWRSQPAQNLGITWTREELYER